MRTIVFASNNAHKAEEIRKVLGNDVRIITMKEAGLDIDIPEPHATFQENAREKSMTIYRLKGCDCFSEDSGLEVEALGGAPGVLSARYAGDKASAKDNIDKLLRAMEGKTNRKARFTTVISLVLDGKEHVFEGTCEGTIPFSPSGSHGFGYDPVFIPDGHMQSFGEMGMEQKVSMSHRKKAVEKMAAFLHAHPL